MNRKIFKAAILFSVSILVLLIKTDNSKGCWFGPPPDSYYSIFVPELYNLPELKPFFLSENKYFPFNETSSLGDKTDNLKDWLKYFDNIPVIDDINDVVYSSNKNDIEEIKEYLKTGKNSPLNVNLKDNTLISYWEKHNYTDVLDYLLYTKECSPYVAVPDYWENFQRDTTGMFKLILAGENKYNECKDNFIKNRYAFQVIRLLHYSGRYEQAVNYYDKYFGNQKNSLIKYWAMEHKAGCLYKLKKTAEAEYLFAKIFDNCLSRRTHCAQSFRCNSDSTFDAILSLCKNTEEKTSVIMLRAYKIYYSSDIDYIDVSSMKQIYSLDPKSKYLELMLQRGLSKMERNILPPTYEDLRSYEIPYKFEIQTSDSYYDFGKLVTKIAEEQKIENPYLWYFAAGYISTLNHENKNADELFIKAKQLCPKENLDIVNRIKIVQVINKVDGYKTIDAKAEAEMLPGLEWLRKNESIKRLKSEDAFYYIALLLRAKYLAQKDSVKASMWMGIRVTINDWYNRKNAFDYNIFDDYYNEPVREIYNLLRAQNLSPYDKFLVANYSFDLNKFKVLIATKDLLQHNFKEAVNLFSDKPLYREYDKKVTLPANPFIIHIKDCSYCDYKAPKDETFNKKTFAERMINLQKLAEINKSNNAEYYFLLANGYYNMTYFGNSWQLVSFNRKFPDWIFGIDRSLPKEFFDCSTAKEYYLKAMNASNDKEFAAKCCFMAAKCDQNKFYNEKYQL